MGKLNTKVYPLSHERYIALTQMTPKTDKAVQCEESKESHTRKDSLQEKPWKLNVESLLCHMKRHDMSWDNEARLVLGTQTVANTHVPSIIKDVCSEETGSIESRASRDFIKLLVLTNFDFEYGVVDG